MKSISSWPWGKIIVTAGALVVGGIIGSTLSFWSLAREAPVSDIIRALAELGVVVVGILAISWTYVSRTSPYRESLYEIQIEAYQEVGTCLMALGGKLSFFLADHPGALDDRQKEELVSACGEEYAGFYAAFSKHFVFLPLEVTRPIGALQKTFLAVTAPGATGERVDSKAARSNTPKLLLHDAGMKVISAMRDSLGVGPLSAETMKQFGSLRQR